MLSRTAMAGLVTCLAAACLLQLAAPAAAAVPDAVPAAPALRADRLMAAEAAELVPEAGSEADDILVGSDGGPLFTDGRKYIFEMTGPVGRCPSKTDLRSLYMTVRYYKGSDARDRSSVYLYGATGTRGVSSFVPEWDSKQQAYRIRHAKKAVNYGDGWYLAVHKHKEDDALPLAEYRVIAHSDPNKAVLWDIWKKNYNTFIFTVQKNLAVPGLAEGMVLGTPPQIGIPYVTRDEDSQYLAVVSDFDCTTLTKIYKY